MKRGSGACRNSEGMRECHRSDWFVLYKRGADERLYFCFVKYG